MSALTSSITKDGMRIYTNPKSVDVPKLDLLTLLFGTSHLSLPSILNQLNPVQIQSTPSPKTTRPSISQRIIQIYSLPSPLSAPLPNASRTSCATASLSAPKALKRCRGVLFLGSTCSRSPVLRYNSCRRSAQRCITIVHARGACEAGNAGA
jgi:hypothetical protein